MKKTKKAVWGWALYDWANSAFATTVMAGFFPIFFKQYWSFGADVNLSTARLGFGNSVASLLVAAMAPLLGAIADCGSARKKFLITFAYLGVIMTTALVLVEKGQWAWAVFIYLLAVIGFSGANIFYDSLLPEVADTENVDMVSSLGFSMGYLGGGLLFLVNVLMTMFPHRFGLVDAQSAVRLSFVTVGIWWGGFTLFTILWVKESGAPSQSNGIVRAMVHGIKQVAETVKGLRQLKPVALFLLAYWFYIDGVDTIVRMAVDYGLSLGFSATDLIGALLIVQFVGFPAALAFGKLGQRWGVRRAIFLAIALYMLITAWAVFMTRRHEFYILAVMIGLVQGGIQALSRSYYSRLIPEGQSAQYFGFYNMLGKFAAIIGPALMGLVGLAVRRAIMPPAPTPEQMRAVGETAARFSIASVLLLFVIGGVLFYLAGDRRPSTS